MMEQLGVGGSYYTCTDHLTMGEDAVRVGSRKRWRGETEFKGEAPSLLLAQSVGYAGMSLVYLSCWILGKYKAVKIIPRRGSPH